MKTRFKPKFNIKKGDQVAVIAGDDKSRTTPRQVLAVYPLKGRVLVEGVNIVTKHIKPSAKKSTRWHCKRGSANQYFKCTAVGCES